MTLKDISPCFVCCKEFLFGGYFILTPHYFDAKQGKRLFMFFVGTKDDTKVGSGKE
jgi:hypothetical protein